MLRLPVDYVKYFINLTLIRVEIKKIKEHWPFKMRNLSLILNISSLKLAEENKFERVMIIMPTVGITLS